MAHYPNLSGVVKGTGFQPAPPAHPPPPNNTRGRQASSPQLGAAADGATSLHPSFADIAAINIRGRSPSIKRKDLEVSPTSELSQNNRSKHARYDSNDSSSLKAVAENLSMLEQVANELLDATSSDPVLVSLSSRLCQGMITQNNILCSLISRHNNNQQVSYESYVCPQPNLGAIPKNSKQNSNNAQVSNVSAPSISDAEKSRKTLKQPPLGLTGNSKWQEVTHGKRQGKKSTNNQADRPEDSAEASADAFASAVKNAEKSIVIYNLNLGQAPLLNPATISSKVTSALIKAAADNFSECGNSTSLAGEMVNDLISQVKSMDLLGKGTKPCKNNKDAGINGSFYTIPVKLTFGNKQVSKHVNEILRQKYKVSTSIPYHRSLKQAITMAHEKVSKKHPGKQVLISLDAPKHCLKPFIRDTPSGGYRKGESGWVSAGNPIPLPSEALNPKLKEVSEDFSLPASPTPVVLEKSADPEGASNISATQSGSGTTCRKLKMTPEVARQLEERNRSKNDDDSVFPPGEEGNTMETSGDETSSPSGLGPEY